MEEEVVYEVGPAVVHDHEQCTNPLLRVSAKFCDVIVHVEHRKGGLECCQAHAGLTGSCA